MRNVGPYVTGFECMSCTEKFPPSTEHLTCPTCGSTGILEVLYDYAAIKKHRFASQPDFRQPFDLWRYRDLLSIPVSAHLSTLHVGGTPMYRSRDSQKIWGVKNLYIKDEGANPTGSLKDRASVIAVVHAHAIGHNTLACSSTGNAASSLAGQAARLGLKTVIFVPERAPIGKLNQLLVYGAQVYKVRGDYQQTYTLSHQAIEHYQWYNRNAAVNPHLVEGKKTVAYEIIEQLGDTVPDWVVVSVGDGCTIAGLYKGFYDFYQLGRIEKIPRLLGVQSAGCAPFYHAWKTQTPLKVEAENTLADSIAVGLPRNEKKGLRAVEQSNGAWITVDDEAILANVKYLGAHEGMFVEPASAATFAGVRQALAEGRITSNETVVAINTGNGLKDPENARKAVGDVHSIDPDFTTFKQTWKAKE